MYSRLTYCHMNSTHSKTTCVDLCWVCWEQGDWGRDEEWLLAFRSLRFVRVGRRSRVLLKTGVHFPGLRWLGGWITQWWWIRNIAGVESAGQAGWMCAHFISHYIKTMLELYQCILIMAQDDHGYFVVHGKKSRLSNIVFLICKISHTILFP